MKARHALLIGSVGFCSLTLGLFASTAHAQEDGAEDAASEEMGGEEGADEAGAGDEKAADEAGTEGESKGAPEEAAKDEQATPEDSGGSTSPAELPGKSYMFVGLRYRGIIVPQFMINMFGEGGDGVYVNGIGPEFSIRKDNFESIFSIWYADYGMDPTTFKAKDDPIDAWEIVESKLKVLYLTADFLWSTDFNPEFALNYGVGAGIGFVWGDLYRQQATPPGGDTSVPPEDWVACPGPGQGQYCGDDNDHYGDYTEDSWASGGSKPIVFPWLALQTGLRYKPHKNFVARLDLGFGTSGFFFGLGADYGL